MRVIRSLALLLAALCSVPAAAAISRPPGLPVADARGLCQPPFVAGRWYLLPNNTALGASAAIANTVRLSPVVICQPLKVQAVAIYVNTAFTGGKCQAALYASDPTTSLPTGTALWSSGDVSTTSTGAATAAVGTPVTVQPGTYWEAVNCDNASAQVSGLATNPQLTSLVGASSAALLLPGNASSKMLRTIAQTYGTWGDLTSATTTEGSTAAPVFGFQAQ